MEVDYVEYDDYTANNGTENNTNTGVHVTFSSPQSSLTYVLVAVNVVISVVGLGGNSVVIWICGWKMRRSVITTWYMSLAISNLLFCAVLPLDIFYMITSHWPFGQVLCKFTSSALFLNMHSSVFLLVLISADRCVLVLFPVWAHNHRTVKKAYGAVALMWFLSALLTLPSMIFRRTTVQDSVTQCHTDYRDDSKHKAVKLSGFICGFLIPFLTIVLCCVVLGMKLRRSTIRSKKPYKIVVALILSFFFCWVPYHAFVLLELDLGNQSLEVLQTGLKVGVTLAAANSVISPILYVFIGNDFKRTLQKSLTSRFEEAIAEDFRTGGPNYSMSKSMEIIGN
ncbi:chemokine-like receptor 1 [Kryptolebias marmoratus]|uniref:Chemokine-like receptor 1 n=1 Tax=Kryptolebias marmoratus TaxID=37003 RepID=A0A3Q3A301_KRYMA|nr:chemokine-like receptor 1 [Kryptolebias marmoratus]